MHAFRSDIVPLYIYERGDYEAKFINKRYEVAEVNSLLRIFSKSLSIILYKHAPSESNTFANTLEICNN